MKLLVVTSLKEYQKTVSKILEQAQIDVFSVSETIGFKDHAVPNLLDQWFSSGSDQFNSIFLFSFTVKTKAEEAMQLIKKYNEEHQTKFPIRAFIIPVDESSHELV